jgi:hypothetical protein
LTKELAIEQMMTVVRKALEMGAKLDISFHRTPSKQEALVIAKQLAEQMGCSFDVRDDKHWINLDRLSALDVTVFYKPSIEDKKKKLLAELAALEQGDQVNEATN